MLPDMDSLALFVRAAELRSLTKAAEASHIGLAAASRRIALLEDRFRTTLFERNSRGVELTAAGVSLLANAKQMLMLMNHMQAEMADHAEGRKGALRIQASTSAMTEFLPEDLASFGQANPDVLMSVSERWSPEIVRSLLASEADLGIVIEGVRTEGLEVFPYRSDRLAVVVPAAHALAEVGALRFADVLDHDIIALEGGASMMRLLAEQAVVAAKTLQLRVQVRSFEAACRMVQSGLGVGLLPFEATDVMGRALGLVVRPLAEPWAERRMLACAKKDRPPNTSLARLIDHLRTRSAS